MWIVITCYIISVAVAADVDYAKNNQESESLDDIFQPVAFFDLTQTGVLAKCPLPWFYDTISGKKMCRAPSDGSGCSSVIFPTYGREYFMIRGWIRGYQKGTPDGFRAYKEDGLGINEAYVDGVSITVGYPRRHVWTYAAGVSAEGNYPKSNCPCAVTRGPDSPPFVGENYYCQSGNQWSPDHATYYYNQSLWQVTGCTNTKNNCCANVGLPWFFRRFPYPEYDDIEVRICYNQAFSDEAILIDQLKLEIF